MVKISGQKYVDWELVLITKKNGASFGVKKMFENWVVISVMKLCKFTKIHCIIQLKQVNLVLCKLYFVEV